MMTGKRPPPLQLPFQVENFILNAKREHTSWGARKGSFCP
jgi:hypothetical protein